MMAGCKTLEVNLHHPFIVDLLAKIADDNIKDGIFKIANVQQQSSVDDATRLGRQGYLFALKVCTSQDGRSLDGRHSEGLAADANQPPLDRRHPVRNPLSAIVEAQGGGTRAGNSKIELAGWPALLLNTPLPSSTMSQALHTSRTWSTRRKKASRVTRGLLMSSQQQVEP